MTSSDKNSSEAAAASATSFTAVAPYYDELMAGVPYKMWVEYVASLLRSHDFAPTSILDLACGTGSAAVEWGIRGYDVVGIDLSEQMVDIARAKAAAADCRIPFYAQDAAELSLDRNFDVVVSLFDSLNNIIEPPRLATAFKRVYDHLKTPGCFIFDMNTEVAFTAGMFNQKSHPIDGPLQYVWRSTYDSVARICTVRMSFTVDDPTAQPVRFEEVHLQRAYAKDEINIMLAAAGFETVTIYDAYTHKPAKKRSDRVFYVAIKGAIAGARACG